MTDEQTITALIERWVVAVQANDLDGVLADHADDIVMFDVPPPQDGVRGLDAYRATWPPFFTWIRSGAVFELVSTEVTAGADVAYAHLLLRCGTPRRPRAPPGAPAAHHAGPAQAGRPLADRARAPLVPAGRHRSAVRAGDP
jgi:ketosteroid isomerase-like protein